MGGKAIFLAKTSTQAKAMLVKELKQEGNEEWIESIELVRSESIDHEQTIFFDNGDY